MVNKKEMIKMRMIEIPERPPVLRAKQTLGGSAFGGGRFIHEGIGPSKMNILAGGRMAAYRAGVRIEGSPIRAPITFTSIGGKAPVFVSTLSLPGGRDLMPLPGSPIARSFGGASTGLAAGGSALARGGPAVGTIPGGGLNIMPAASAGGGLSVAAGGLGLGGIGESITSTGTGIVNMVKQYIPLAVKVILAVIVIKIVLWLIRGKK